MLIPGWTLNYEMFFYLLFALALATKRLIPVLFTAIGILVAVGLVWQPQAAIAQTYTSPRLLEFAAGVGIGILFARARIAALSALLPLGIAGVLLAGTFLSGTAADVPLRMVSSAAVVAGAVAWESARGMPVHRSLKILGDASYSLYLTHTMTLVLVFDLWKHVPLDGWAQFIGMLLTAFVLCTVIGAIVHVYVEKPLLRQLRPLTRSSFRHRTAPKV